MNIFFSIIGALTWLYSIVAYMSAQNVSQQSVGAELFIAGSVLMVGGQIISQVKKNQRTIKTTKEEHTDANLGAA